MDESNEIKVENGTGGIQMSIRLWLGWVMVLLLVMMILSVENMTELKVAPERLGDVKGWVG